MDKEAKRSMIILCHSESKASSVISKILSINRWIVYRTIKRYKETGSTQDMFRKGRPRSVRTPAVRKLVRDGVRKNPVRSIQSMARIVKEDLGLKCYKFREGAITSDGRTPLVFIDKGVKINKEVYVESILDNALKPWACEHFNGTHWVFQQDSAPSHKAKMTSEWLKLNVPEFISTKEWPASSPDLNPMDFCIWSILESRVCAKPHKNVESLKSP
ncbi:hypothetical protein LOD99_10184 [Oopsacas minuta]|uniref:Transposase n=1 Tax=Oopsacas minuta TaxID=111878 RepID=A0AAV7KIE4_9METZ|nr:hypothetical protein LOD99_10184 [Oopsacas minuta]